MTLGELITTLEAADPTLVVAEGFTNPHSYRGDYMDIAFEPAASVSVSNMLDSARSALGATFTGYKGGEFTMTADTWCWLSAYGDASCETLSSFTLRAMLASAVVPVPADADLRNRIAQALADVTGARWPAQAFLTEADAVLAVLPAPADRAATLTDPERQFLTFALDLAADQMASRGGEFTADDEAALERFRRMTTAPATRAAVLREAAVIADQLLTPDCAEMSSLTNAWDCGTYAVATELRRRADEAPQP